MQTKAGAAGLGGKEDGRPGRLGRRGACTGADRKAPGLPRAVGRAPQPQLGPPTQAVSIWVFGRAGPCLDFANGGQTTAACLDCGSFLVLK